MMNLSVNSNQGLGIEELLADYREQILAIAVKYGANKESLALNLIFEFIGISQVRD